MEVPVLLDVLDNLPKKMWDWYGFEMVRYEGSKFGPTFLCIGKSVRGTMYAVAMNGLSVIVGEDSIVFDDGRQRVSISRTHYNVESVCTLLD